MKENNNLLSFQQAFKDLEKGFVHSFICENEKEFCQCQCEFLLSSGIFAANILLRYSTWIFYSDILLRTDKGFNVPKTFCIHFFYLKKMNKTRRKEKYKRRKLKKNLSIKRQSLFFKMKIMVERKKERKSPHKK